jgi:hypothetical protein
MSTAICNCEHVALDHEQWLHAWDPLVRISGACTLCDCTKFAFNRTDAVVDHGAHRRIKGYDKLSATCPACALDRLEHMVSQPEGSMQNIAAQRIKSRKGLS